LKGEKLPFSREELEKILSYVMKREFEIDLLQERSERFWTIKYLQEQHELDPKPLDVCFSFFFY